MLKSYGEFYKLGSPIAWPTDIFPKNPTIRFLQPACSPNLVVGNDCRPWQSTASAVLAVLCSTQNVPSYLWFGIEENGHPPPFQHFRTLLSISPEDATGVGGGGGGGGGLIF